MCSRQRGVRRSSVCALQQRSSRRVPQRLSPVWHWRSTDGGLSKSATIVGFGFCGLLSQQTLVASQGNDSVQLRVTTCDGSSCQPCFVNTSACA